MKRWMNICADTSIKSDIATSKDLIHNQFLNKSALWAKIMTALDRLEKYPLTSTNAKCVLTRPFRQQTDWDAIEHCIVGSIKHLRSLIHHIKFFETKTIVYVTWIIQQLQAEMTGRLIYKHSFTKFLTIYIQYN